ncbi:MAG: threonine--tRNA ligase [bacterium]|nr:threonine--tRNA ligase [bacterium]
MPHDQEYLSALRHSCAHLLGASVTNLYPDSKRSIGPSIENGFYYDFEFTTPLSDEDLPKIEAEMARILPSWTEMTHEEVSPEHAKERFAGNPYKLELIDEFSKEGQTLTIYKSGDFEDLCKGGHAGNPSKEIVAFKLLNLAGAYWRGDEKNIMLTRIYGTCFSTKEELDAHLNMLEEAKLRDHRKIGKEQELFYIDELVGKGLALWLPNGTIIRTQIERLAERMEEQGGYERVVTPHIAKEELFITSGHLPYYKDSMYPEMKMDDGTYYLKAMNCPPHHIIYRHKPRSYRELPVRLAEYGTVYRNELSGTLAGLLRVRAMAMNDAHIYCRKDQIKTEFKSVMEMMMEYFRIFDLKDYWFRLSKWSPDHVEKYINQPENWEYSEQVLREVLSEMNVPYTEADDEAAFYGPKVDVQFKSVLGREETMSTVQLDFMARERFELSYIDETGQHNDEVFVIHRAPLSTHERFVAFLIEHYAGVWPVWLSPVQVEIVSVAESHISIAQELAEILKKEGVRVHVDDSNESVGYKVRNAAKSKIPYIIVIGEKEKKLTSLSIRVRGEEAPLVTSVADFVVRIKGECEVNGK